MPAGVPNGVVHCYRCNTEYANFSELRKHQWAAHPKKYKARRNSFSWSPEQHAKYRATIAAKKLGKELTVRQVIGVYNNGTPKPEMTAKELLDKLVSQRDFMNDVCSLVEGLMREN